MIHCIAALMLCALPTWSFDPLLPKDHPYPYRYGYKLYSPGRSAIDFEPHAIPPRWHELPNGARIFGATDSEGHIRPELPPGWVAFYSPLA